MGELARSATQSMVLCAAFPGSASRVLEVVFFNSETFVESINLVDMCNSSCFGGGKQGLDLSCTDSSMKQ